MKSKYAIDINGLTKSYPSGKQQLYILNQLNLRVRSGSAVAISGESGAGKSTLLHIIGGIDTADSGRAFVAYHELRKLSEYQLSAFRNAQIGFIFQSYYLLSDFTALENVMMPALIGGAARTTAEESAQRLLTAVQLQQRAHHFPNQLSGGELQRVAFARALINNPTILLADEPTGNLDEENSRIIEQLLFALVKRFNKTLVVVSHDHHMAELADIHFTLTHGQLHPA